MFQFCLGMQATSDFRGVHIPTYEGKKMPLYAHHVTGSKMSLYAFILDMTRGYVIIFQPAMWWSPHAHSNRKQISEASLIIPNPFV